MSRRTVVTAVCGLLLAGGLAGPALAETNQREMQSVVCLELNGDNPRAPEGVCVWAPLPDKPLDHLPPLPGRG